MQYLLQFNNNLAFCAFSVTLDPVEEYLKNISRLPQHVDPVASCSTCSQTLRISGRDKISETENSTAQDDRLSFPGSMPPPSKRLRRSQRISTRVFAKNEPDIPPGLRKKYTCGIILFCLFFYLLVQCTIF